MGLGHGDDIKEAWKYQVHDSNQRKKDKKIKLHLVAKKNNDNKSFVRSLWTTF